MQMSPIILTKDYAKRLSARAVPGSVWESDEKAWVMYDRSPRGAAIALHLFPELGAKHPELIELREDLAKDVRPADYAEQAGLKIEDDAPTVAEVLKSEGKWWFDFQNQDLGYLKAVLEAHGGAYIGWERGLGKTLAACTLIDALRCERTLVVAPNTAKLTVWAAEVRRFLPEHEVVVLPNGKEQREHCVTYMKGGSAGPVVFIVHYEALAIIGENPEGKALKARNGWDRLREWDLVICDEAHRIKNPKAKMVKALKRIRSQYKLALSGSIIENKLEELFSPLQWLFPEHYGSRWRDWNDRFLDYADGPFGRICVGVKPEALQALRDELGVFLPYRRKEDELDLPERTEQSLYVDLTPGQRRAYEDLQATCLAQLDTGHVLAAPEGLVMLTRLRQLATGLDLVAEGVRDSCKLDVAEELVRDNDDEAFVIFTWFKAAGHAMYDRLTAKGVECFLIDGDVKHEDRDDYIARFQAGERRVFIGTLSTLGESVNLFRATNAIFLDRSWNPATNAQAADRIYRIGQTNAVTITHVVARDTVDEVNVLPALSNKEALRRAVLGGKDGNRS